MKSIWSLRFAPKAPATQGEDRAAGVLPTVAELVALRGRLAGGTWQRMSATVPAGGAHRARQPGPGMEFAELRPYQRGDDVRSIDWRHTARRGRTYTKVFHAERERPLMLLVDLQPSMRFGTRVAFKSVIAARAAALLAWSAADASDRVGAVLCDAGGYRFVPPRRRQSGVLELVRALVADVEPVPAHPPSSAAEMEAASRGTGFAAALRALSRAAAGGSDVVVLSDFRSLDADTQAALAALAGRHSLALVHVFDPVEAEPPPPGVYRIADANGERTVDLRLAAVRDAYGTGFRARRDALAALAQRLGATQVPLATDADPMRVLLALTATASRQRPAGPAPVSARIA